MVPQSLFYFMSLCLVEMMSDFLAVHEFVARVVSRRNSFLSTVLILSQNSKLLFMDLVVVKEPHYFLVVFNVVLKLSRNEILCRRLEEIVRSLLFLFSLKLLTYFLLVKRFAFEPLFQDELGEDCTGLVLNDDDLVLYYQVQNGLRSNEKSIEYELNFEIATESLTFLFPFYIVDHGGIRLFFRPSFLLFTLITCRFLATSLLREDSYFLFVGDASYCSCSLFLQTYLGRKGIN